MRILKETQACYLISGWVSAHEFTAGYVGKKSTFWIAKSDHNIADVDGQSAQIYILPVRLNRPASNR